MSRIHPIAVVPLLLASLACVAGEAAPTAGAAPEAQCADEAPAMRAWRDPKTGQWVSRPATPEDAQRATRRTEATSKSSEDLVVERLPDGSERVDLRGRFQSTARVERRVDGSLAMDCNVSALPADVEPADADR